MASAEVLAAETKIDTPLDEVNAHFAVASKHYGDGKVQVHSRTEDASGSRHSVYTVDCKEQTYSKNYDAAQAPDVFPFEDYDNPAEPLNRTSAAVPAAQYACAEHGHPLLEWRW